MACISPLVAYRSRSLSEKGKRPLVFNKKSGFSDLPVTIPCGNCIGCRIARARVWALRCVHESRMHVFNSFVTLTFDDENLPSDTGVSKRDLQLFFKRLRKAGFEFRYFACGEYGESSLRPHYHIIFFGIDFHADRRLYRRTKAGNLYTSDSLTAAWPFGHAIIANFSYQTAQYVSKYVLKKRTGDGSDLHADYQRFDFSTGELFYVEKQFVIMSRRPGLGSSWYEEFKSDAFPSDFLVHQEKKFGVPKFYYDKLESTDSTLHRSIKSKRRRLLKLSEASRDPARLMAKAEILKNQQNQFKRSL